MKRKTEFTRLRGAQHRASRLVTLCLALMTGAWSYAIGAQTAQWVPTDPVELITGTGTGGSLDRALRLMQKIIQDKKLVSVPILVTNKPGGRGTISINYMNRRPSDGHVLVLAGAGTMGSYLMGLVDVNMLTDMTVIAQLYHEYPVSVVGSTSPIKDGKELIARLAKSPESLSIGLVSPGGAQHTHIALAAIAAGIDPKRLKIVVFKSGSEVLTAVLGGHVDVGISSPSLLNPSITNGTVRAMAISAPQRLTGGTMSKVPTWKELGFESIASVFRTMVGPRDLPDAQIAYWEEVLVKVASSEEWRGELDKNIMVGDFLKSKQAYQALASEQESLKMTLTKMGMAKVR